MLAEKIVGNGEKKEVGRGSKFMEQNIKILTKDSDTSNDSRPPDIAFETSDKTKFF